MYICVCVCVSRHETHERVRISALSLESAAALSVAYLLLRSLSLCLLRELDARPVGSERHERGTRVRGPQLLPRQHVRDPQLHVAAAGRPLPEALLLLLPAIQVALEAAALLRAVFRRNGD